MLYRTKFELPLSSARYFWKYFSLLILSCETLNLSIYFRRRLSPNGEMKLPELPAEPVYDATLGEAKYKTSDRIIEARGYEPIHTEVTCIIVH